MRVKINQKKLDELKTKLKPKATIWALLGILVFFFLPEILAYLYPQEIKAYFINLSKLYENPLIKRLCLEMADELSQNSFLNIMIGFGFVWWWWHERKKSSQS
jgi:hypothetical protein